MERALEKVRPHNATKGIHKVIGDAVEVIAGCGPDINQLWADDEVQRVLAHRNLRLNMRLACKLCLHRNIPCLLDCFSFLNDVDRIAKRDYDPSDNDIVRARLRTMGVQEYYFSFGIVSTNACAYRLHTYAA